ncbi:hypothetical protein SNK12g_13730 [Lactiplantibacillus plantarum]
MAVTKIDLKTTMTYREHAITSKSFARKLGLNCRLRCTQWRRVKVLVLNNPR